MITIIKLLFLIFTKFNKVIFIPFLNHIYGLNFIYVMDDLFPVLTFINIYFACFFSGVLLFYQLKHTNKASQPSSVSSKFVQTRRKDSMSQTDLVRLSNFQQEHDRLSVLCRLLIIERLDALDEMESNQNGDQ